MGARPIAADERVPGSLRRVGEGAALALVAALVGSAVTQYLAGAAALYVLAAAAAAALLIAVPLRGGLLWMRRHREGLRRLAALERELERLTTAVMTIDEDRVGDVIEAARREGVEFKRAEGRIKQDWGHGFEMGWVEDAGDGQVYVHTGHLAPGLRRHELIEELRKDGFRLDGI